MVNAWSARVHLCMVRPHGIYCTLSIVAVRPFSMEWQFPGRSTDSTGSAPARAIKWVNGNFPSTRLASMRSGRAVTRSHAGAAVNRVHESLGSLHSVTHAHSSPAEVHSVWAFPYSVNQ